MRIQFRERPWDLYVAVGYTTLAAIVTLGLGFGNVLAVLSVLFVPGYILLAFLIPENERIDWTERVVLSLGISIAVVPLLVLFLNFTPWGISFHSVIITTLLFSCTLGYGAHWRRMRLPADKRLAATWDLSIPGWQEHRLRDKLLATSLAASVVIAAGYLAYVVLTPHPGETFTEFFILGPGGNASGYPTTLNASQPGTVMLGIANHEAATVNYAVRVDLVGVQIVFNSTAGHNETIEVNRTTQSWINATSSEGQNWTQRYTFSIPFPGLWKLQFLLYKNGVLTKQELHRFIIVS